MRTSQRAAIIAATQVVLQGDDPGSVASVSFDLPPASIDTRERAYREGNGGSNYALAYVVISPTIYLWWSHDGAGADPGALVTALAGMTGIEVALAAGNHTAAAVATATRAAATTAGLTASGSGATVTLAGEDIDGTPITTGEPAATRGERLWYGHRHSTGDFGTDGLAQAVGARMVSPSGSRLLDAIGVHLVGATSDLLRLSVYTGGGVGDPSGTTLLCEGELLCDGTGWFWLELSDDQAAIVAGSTSLWAVAKADAASGALRSTAQGVDGSDIDSSTAIYVWAAGTGPTQIDPDPTVPFPASLGSISVDATFSVELLIAVRLRPADEGTDASLLTEIGTHGTYVLAGSESALTVPDAGGANPSVHTVAPDVLGLELHDLSVAYGSSNTTPHRLCLYEGGSGPPGTDRTGATVLWDAGQTSSGITEAWATITAPTGGSSIPVAPLADLWPTLRNNGGATIRYAPFGAPESGGPRWDPPDYVIGTGVGTGGEYESLAANTAHATNPATPFESPSVADASDFLPGNGPGLRYRLRVPGIVAS